MKPMRFINARDANHERGRWSNPASTMKTPSPQSFFGPRGALRAARAHANPRPRQNLGNSLRKTPGHHIVGELGIRARHAGRMLLYVCAATLATLTPAEEASPTSIMLPNGGAQIVRCLMPVQIRDTEVLSEHHIVFYTGGNRRYLLEFPQGCGGLHKDGSFRFQSSGNGYCQDDRLQPLTLASPGSGFWGTPCPVSGFRPVTEAEVRALKSRTAQSQ